MVDVNKFARCFSTWTVTKERLDNIFVLLAWSSLLKKKKRIFNKSRNCSWFCKVTQHLCLSHNNSLSVKFGWGLLANCSQVAHATMSWQITQCFSLSREDSRQLLAKPTSCKKLWFIPALPLWLGKWWCRSCIWGLLLFSCPYLVWKGVLYTSAFRLYQIHIRLSSAWLVLQRGPSVVASLRYEVQPRKTWENKIWVERASKNTSKNVASIIVEAFPHFY